MKRLINTTTILSMALYVVPPFAAQAQDLQQVMVGDQTVICLPNKQTVCPDGAFCVIAKKPANCQSNAEKAVADGAVSAGIAAEAGVATDPAATDQAATDQAAADKVAADQAAADLAAADQAAADQAAADKAAADQAAADKAAADHAAAEKAAADQAAADQAAAQAAAEKAAADQAAAQAAAEKAAADRAATAVTPPTLPDQPVTQFNTVSVAGTEVICLPTKADVCPEGATCVVAAKKAKCMTLAEEKLAAGGDTTTQTATDTATGTATDPATDTATNTAADPTLAPTLPPIDQAALDQAAVEQAAMDKAAIKAARKAAKEAAAAAAADPNFKPVEAPVPDQQAVDTLENVLGATADADPALAPTSQPVTDAAVAAQAGGTDVPPADQPVPADATVTTETVTEADTRASSEDFAAAPVTVAPGKKSGLSDLEKVGLVALGALVIGSMLKNKQEVVQNTGDRVVVRQPDGTYQVYKDDNSLLRQPGSKVTTQTFKDGSTRSIVTRDDGSQIVTIRDASGRVLQRVAYDTKGNATVLIDDLQPEKAVDVTKLPKPLLNRQQISLDENDATLRAQLAAARSEDLGQRFSLRQIRNIQEVRYLAPTVNVNNITFETGSAAIQPTEAKKLSNLGKFLTRLIRANPGEVFLIEGHTDAVGSAASNLSLSDRRAESVAKALTEYFGVPPENLVVQGYGETELKIPTLSDERANRRVAVRVITPLLMQ